MRGCSGYLHRQFHSGTGCGAYGNNGTYAFIRWGAEAGTAFTVEYQGKLYIITAKHVVAGITDTNAVIQVRVGDKWEDYQTTNTIYPSSPDVDIAIFATNEKQAQPYAIEPISGSSSVTFGQQLWFIGYPYGIGSNIPGHAFPFLNEGRCRRLTA
jgi:S1-C subfamily serine protease